MDLKERFKVFLTEEKAMFLVASLSIILAVDWLFDMTLLTLILIIIVLGFMAFGLHSEEAAKLDLETTLKNLFMFSRDYSSKVYQSSKEGVSKVREQANEYREKQKEKQMNQASAQQNQMMTQNDQQSMGGQASQMNQNNHMNYAQGKQQGQGNQQGQPTFVQPFVLEKKGKVLNYFILFAGPVLLLFILLIISSEFGSNTFLVHGGLTAIVGLFLFNMVYFLPALIAYSEWKYIIFILSIFLSWTLFIWVILLAVAYITNSNYQKDQYQQYQQKLMFEYLSRK